MFQGSEPFFKNITPFTCNSDLSDVLEETLRALSGTDIFEDSMQVVPIIDVQVT